MLLVTGGNPSDPVLDMAVSHALLRQVGAGGHAAAARLFVPGPTVAFGRLDRLREGFPAAVHAAAEAGYAPVLRLGGGHAAAYDEGSVLLELALPVDSAYGGLEERFALGSGVLVDALASLGVAVTVGEQPGEYCPGRWSLHLPGGPKVAGTAQRVIRGAALFTAVLVVDGGDRLRNALIDVYAALELEMDPRTVGGVADHHPGVTVAAVETALDHVLAARFALRQGPLGPETTALAEQVAGGHRLPG